MSKTNIAPIWPETEDRPAIHVSPVTHGSHGPEHQYEILRLCNQVHGIQLLVAMDCGVGWWDIMGRSRIAKVTEARRISIYLAAKVTGLSHSEIAAMLNRDRSSVSIAIREMESLVTVNPTLATRMTRLSAAAIRNWP